MHEGRARVPQGRGARLEAVREERAEVAEQHLLEQSLQLRLQELNLGQQHTG